jgi:hypothetical protein
MKTAKPIQSDLTTLKIALKTDNYGKESWFYVLDLDYYYYYNYGYYNIVLYSYDKLSNNKLYNFTAEVDKTHCYEVNMMDDAFDGLCCGYGQGYYEIWWNGKFTILRIHLLFLLGHHASIQLSVSI